MKIDRLIGIITILLQNKKITAPQLAEIFEVSRRTIHRDIEDICKAGIPIVTTQGTNGGIAIMDSFKIEKTLFSVEDLSAIFAGLCSLDSITQSNKYKNIIMKFSAQKDSLILKNNILIDLSSHYKDTLAPKIELLQASIENSTQVSFCYHNHSGERCIVADPYLVIFQWSSWYLLGFDDARKQFKLYKLNRLCDLHSTKTSFQLQEIPKETLEFSNFFTEELQAVILFDKSEKYRLVEEYGVDSFTETPEGSLLFSFPFTNQNYLLSWVLSFGENAELMEPKELRPILQERLKKTLEKYF
ncbi:MAG: YafY family protein [Anaerotignum sp.]|nr:YafY family protein [Anaerotignum sp.]